MALTVIGNADIVRPVASFAPSLWGDRFVNYNWDAKVAEKNSKVIEEFKVDVNSKLTSLGSNKVELMKLSDLLERLGISYHFENEIEQKLEQLFNLQTSSEDDESYDLYTVALHFRVFRQHGHHVSCNVFKKFTDGNNKFNEAHTSDVKGLLSLYEAAPLRMHGEDILEEALAFARANLNSLASNLDDHPLLKKQVLHALVQPLHFSHQRLEARNFISVFEDDESLVKFAKLDYNLVQMLHKKELQEVSSWWKELDLVSRLPYTRNRVVECFFWATGIYYEPQYSRARVMLAKIMAMVSIMDDTYDAYGTIEELDIFTEAIERWDISEVDDHLPAYIRPFYRALLELYEQLEEELTKEGRSYATAFTIKSLKETAKSFNAEAKWIINKYLPPFDEYMQHAVITSSVNYLTNAALLGCKSALREDFEWLCKNPKMLQAGEIITRFIDDAATYEVEKSRSQIAIGIECYMKETDAGKEEAKSKFCEMAINAWKDINEKFMKPYSSSSKDVLVRILNFQRVVEVVYKNNEDGYTHPEKVLKPHIILLFVDPINTN